MEINELTLPKEQLESEYQALKEALDNNHQLKVDALHQDLMRAYRFLRDDKPIIDIYEALPNAGLTRLGDPRLAIARADAHRCYLTKYPRGGCIFATDHFRYNQYFERRTKGDILLPNSSFAWRFRENEPRLQWSIERRHIMALVPTIPGSILVKEVKHHLRNYYILWEVDEWVEDQHPQPPRDPFLLKRLNRNLFGILAAWHLTDLERAVIRGAIMDGKR